MSQESDLAPLPTGARKAAVILSLLGEDAGAEILKFLDGDEIKQVSAAMLGVGTLPQDAVSIVIDDFLHAVQDGTYDIGGWDQVERLLRRALPEDLVASVMQEVSTLSRFDIWRKLPNVDRGVFLAYLKGEHPQTIAFIMSQVTPDFAATLLTKLNRKLASDVISRMLQMQPVQQDALNAVEEVLRIDFLAVTANRRKADTHAAMAEVFNYFDPESGAELMSDLARLNESSAKRVKSLMFTFKDMVKLDAAAIQTVIQAIDKELLPKALSGVEPVIADLFLNNMSTRSAKRLRDDMAALAAPQKAEIEAAQTEILKETKALLDSGEIAITRLEEAA